MWTGRAGVLQRRSSGGVQGLAEHAHEQIDLRLLDDERRGELDRVAAVPDVDALREALHRDLERALGRFARKGVDREAGGETVVANVGDVLEPLQAVYR